MDFNENTDIRELVVGCRERDDAAFAELVRRYTPMMHKVISSYPDLSAIDEELFSEACVALHSAAMSYDLEQSSVTFGLYARICVQHRMVDLARAGRISSCDVDSLPGDVEDGDSIVSGLADRETFDTLMSSAKGLLTDYEYKVLILHIQGYKTADIAKALDRTAKSVDNAKFRLFRRLRAALGGVSDI